MAMTGPSRDMQAMTVGERQYREEPFQFNSERIPVSLRKRTRPATSAPRTVEIPLGRTGVLIRNSNVRPIEAGDGQSSSQWRVNDGDHNPPSHLGVDATTDPTVPVTEGGLNTSKLIGLGIALGLGAYLLTKKW